jgi:hypothetical protein
LLEEIGVYASRARETASASEPSRERAFTKKVRWTKPSRQPGRRAAMGKSGRVLTRSIRPVYSVSE